MTDKNYNTVKFCISCGCIHSGMCPPFEARTTGRAGLAESYAEACKYITQLEKKREHQEAVEAAARTFVEYDGANDELDYLHYGEYFDALKDALEKVK